MEPKPAQPQMDTRMPLLGLEQSKRDLKLKKWESHREEIYQVYVTQGNTLRKTMQFMREKYNFKHSERKYKEKIKQWNFEKYLSAEETKFMVEKATLREKNGKCTTFYKNGVKIDPKRIEKSAKRKREDSEELGSMESLTAPTPQQITYETPLPYNDDDPVPLAPKNNKKQRIQDSTPDRPDPLAPSMSTIPRQITQETPLPDNDLLSSGRIHDEEQRFRDTMPIVIDMPPHSPPLQTPDTPKIINKGSLKEIECDADSVVELSNSWTGSKTDVESNNEFSSLFQINDERSGESTAPTVVEVPDEETEKVAWAHKQAGNLAEASTEYLRLVEKYTRIYGSESVFNLKSLSILAGIYQTQNLLLKSITAYAMVVHGYKKIYGTSALETLQAMHSLAKVLEENGNQIEAESLYRRAIAGFDVLGESGLAPLLNSQHFLGDLLCDKECYTEAEPLLDAAIAGYRSLGMRHLEIVALGSLLEVYNGEGDLWNVKRTISEMRKLFEELICADQNQLPEILIEGIHLANVYSALIEDDDAESLLSRIIPKLELLSDAKYGIEKVYGYIEYGCLYQNQERWKEASEYLHLAQDGLYKLNRHSDPVVRFVEARLMEVRTYSGGAYNRHDDRHELSKEKLEQVHGGLRRRYQGGSEGQKASKGSKSVTEEASEMETASCKYGVTFSGSDVTGVSHSQFYRP